MGSEIQYLRAENKKALDRVLPFISTTVKPAENLGIYYSELIPVLIKAVQEQQSLIQQQAEKIKELEVRISKVER